MRLERSLRSPASCSVPTRAAATSTPTTRRPIASGCPGSSPRGCRSRRRPYAALLDAWGGDLLARGVIELKFVGMVLEDERVRAVVEVDDTEATFEVTSESTGRTAVVGTARLPPA